LLFFVGVALFSAGRAQAQHIVAATPTPPTVTGGAVFFINVTVVPGPTPVPLSFYSHDVSAAPFSGAAGVVPPWTGSYPFPFPTLPVPEDTVARFTVVQSNTTGLAIDAEVVVLTPRVQSLAFSPGPIVTGGLEVIGTVNLNAAAPRTGAVVSLVSVEPSLAAVPPWVVVSPGATDVSFPVIVQPVAAPVDVELWATRAGSTEVATLTIEPPTLVSLSFTDSASKSIAGVPVDALGGYVAEGICRLSGPAPDGGLPVELASDQPNVLDVLNVIAVPAGSETVVFGARTVAVSAPTLVQVSGRSPDGATAVASVNVVPPRLAAVEVSPASVIGGQPGVGTVYLEGIAPAGGVTVELESVQPTAVILPTEVVVGIGGSWADFEIATTRVTRGTGVGVIARSGADVVRTTAVLEPSRLGDDNGDGDVDTDDYAVLEDCFVDPAGTATGRCQGVFGFTPDESVDLSDFAGFQRAFTGPLDGSPRITVQVDDEVSPSRLELEPLAGGSGARPLGAVTDETGFVAEFVQNELMLLTGDPAALNAFLARWEGVVLRQIEVPDPNQPDLTFYLVRINADLADRSTLGADLGDLIPEASDLAMTLRASSEADLRLLTAAAQELAQGTQVGVNWIPKPQGYMDRTTEEAPIGPGDYVPNAYCWDYLNAGSLQDIGVTEAWRALDVAGLLVPESVEVAVVDAGFQTSVASPNPDLPPPTVLPDSEIDPYSLTNPMECGGWDCPYHGTNVLSSLMAIPDNSLGVAGVAGPIASPKIFVTTDTFSDYEDYYTIVAAIVEELSSAGSRIFNMSGAVRVPGYLAPLAELLNSMLRTFDVISDEILIFGAAGNNGWDIDCKVGGYETSLMVPCELDHVICVGGLAANSLDRDEGSNFGRHDVDIWAPFTVWVGPDPAVPEVHQVSGTSFATPYAAGVAALIWATNPSLSDYEVWEVMRDTAHDSPHGAVRRYVDAHDAVLHELPGAPPDICIVSPGDGSGCGVGGTCSAGSVGPAAGSRGIVGFSGGLPIRFDAWVGDADQDPGTLDVVWTSDLEGGTIGTGSSFWIRDLSYGTHTVRATVTDADGFSVFDEVIVVIVNDSPKVEIIEPLGDWEFCVGETITLRAHSFDPNLLGNPLPGGNLAWFSSWDGPLGSGEELRRSLSTAASHIITIIGHDGNGLTDTDAVVINILPQPCDMLLTVAIIEPSSDVEAGDPDYLYDGFDSFYEMWYKDVTLRAFVFDEEEGQLGGGAINWLTDRTDLSPHAFPNLGMGSTITARLYSDSQQGTWHKITLIATDSDGNQRQAVRWIYIWNLI